MIPNLQDLSIAGGLLAGLLVALEAGFRMGRRAAVEADADRGAQVGSIQGAILGLLALLLAFSFAAAGTRFLERQDLIVEEANAIGTSYLRADLLDEPHRSELRAALKSYTEHRIRTSRDLRDGLRPDEIAEIDRLHARIWSAATRGGRGPAGLRARRPPSHQRGHRPSRHARCRRRKHLPFLVMGLLVASSLLAIGVIGYGCGLGGRRRAPLTVPLAILIGTAMWVTIDLDHPRAGFMQLSDAPLEALRFDPVPER